MATRDELRVRLQADVGPYAGQMATAERSTKKVVDQTNKWRQSAMQASTVATGLSGSLVAVSGSSTAAARGLTAVTVASRALAITPAGAAMTALGFAAGLLMDELQKLRPEVKGVEDALKNLDDASRKAREAWDAQITSIDKSARSIRDLRRAVDEAWLPREQQIVNELEGLRATEYAQERDLELMRERGDTARDYTAAQARLGKQEEEYLQTVSKRITLEKELSGIHDARAKAEDDAARKRREAADRELSTVMQMAQRRVAGATDAAQKEEAARQAGFERQAEQLRAQIETAERRLDIEQKIADKLLEQSYITESEHKRRSQQITAARIELDVSLDDMNIRLEKAAEHTKAQMEKLREQTEQTREVVGELVSSGVNAVFAEWTRDLEGAQRVAAELARTVAQIAAQALISRIGQSALSGAGGGNWPKFAGGGQVHGPGTGTSDSIVARLSRGEFVVRAAAVERVGVSMLEAINSMQMPRFAGGGQAGGQAAEVRLTVANFSDEREIERFLSSRAGERVIRNHVRRQGG